MMYIWVFMIEVRELVGFLKKKKESKLSNITDKHSTGLYHADDLGIFGKSSVLQIEQRKKKIIRIFEDCGFSITVTS